MTTSNLLDRYLQAIGDYLPAATRADVLAELRANLQAQIDDRAEELNRPLTDPEVAAILRDHGRPIVVAARYLPQQYLIGPAIFPYYLMTLRKAAPFAIVIIFLANCSGLAFVHTFPELIAGIFRALGLLIPNLFLFAAWITVAFAIAEYVLAHNDSKPFMKPWDPTKLPELKPVLKGKSRASRIFDLIFHCLFLAYVLEIPYHPFLIFGPTAIYFQKFSVAFAPIWHTYYILLIVLLGLQLIAKILAINPNLDRWLPSFELFTKLIGIVSAIFLASMKTYFVATGPGANPAAIANVNYWLGISFRIVVVVAIADFLFSGWKLLRPSFQARSLVF